MPAAKAAQMEGRCSTSYKGKRIHLRLQTDEGVEGWGEATALPRWGAAHGRNYGETVQAAVHAIHDILAPLLLKADPRTPAVVIDTYEDVLRGPPYAKAAIQMPLQDSRGKLLGEPLYRFLGGRFRDRIWVAHMIGLMDESNALREAEQASSRDRVASFQIKGGAKPDREVALIRRPRLELSKRTLLRLDANRAYGADPKGMLKIAKRLEAAGVDAIEQPGSSTQVVAACRAAVSVPIIADESCWEAQDVLELWQAKAVDAISIYAAKAGGVARALAAAQVAAVLGMLCDVNGSLESGMGTVASLHLAMACRNATLPCVVSVPLITEHRLTGIAGRYWHDDVLTARFNYEAG